MKNIKQLLLILYVLSLTIRSFAQLNATWSPLVSGTNSDLRAIRGGIAVGNKGIILKSTNNGNNWYQVTSGTPNLLTSISSPVSPFFVCGSNGTIIKSTDYGITWSLLNSGTSANLNAIYRFSGNFVFTAGNNGTVLLTLDGGITWLPKTSGTTAALNGFGRSYFNTDRTWIVGNSGTILYTTNLGDSWTLQNITTNSLNSIVFGSQLDTGWICGSSGLILKTTNSGNNWFQIPSGTNSNLNFITIRTGIYPKLYVCGSNGLIMSSTNGGANWLQEFTGITNNIFSTDTYYAVGSNGTILVSTDIYPVITSILLDPNQISAWYKNNGVFHSNPSNGNAGFEWPKGTNKYAIYSSGLWLGCKIHDSIRIALSHYGSEFFPGYIDYQSQIPYGKHDPNYRFYKVSPNLPGGGNGFDSWSVWPVNQGAPWIDVNHNGIYEPPQDYPEMKGEQNLYCAFTDGYPESHSDYSGRTKPLNADIHLYIWAKENPFCADVNYMEFKIINKKNANWDSLYTGMWSDVDIGVTSNDKDGCDTTLNLGYVYKGGGNDPQYGTNCPAVGFMPYIVSRHTSRTMDVYNGFRKNSPPQDEPHNFIATFNGLKGLIPNTGEHWINPITNQPSVYTFSGDPEQNTGWLDPWAEDRRFMMSSYIGTVTPLDTVKYYVAVFIKRGTNHVNSVTQLKYCANHIIAVNPLSNTFPRIFKLYQNYPNPFNPVTKIKFDIPKISDVKIRIFDLLGREVVTLVNEKMKAGTYEREFDASDFSSGVYFYKFETDNFNEVKKMIVLK